MSLRSGEVLVSRNQCQVRRTGKAVGANFFDARDFRRLREQTILRIVRISSNLKGASRSHTII